MEAECTGVREVHRETSASRVGIRAGRPRGTLPGPKAGEAPRGSESPQCCMTWDTGCKWWREVRRGGAHASESLAQPGQRGRTLHRSHGDANQVPGAPIRQQVGQRARGGKSGQAATRRNHSLG